MMKKNELSETLIQLWSIIDQAPYDMMIKDAFRNCPVKIQKQFIKDILDNNAWEDYNEELISRAKDIIK